MNPMRTRYVLILTAFAAGLAATTPMFAQEGRMLRTMPHGVYQCALPGDANGDAYKPVPSEKFTIGPASSYSMQSGNGVYLMRGKELVFTRGPKKGQQFKRVGSNQLQRMKTDGTLDKLLCTRLSATG